MFNSYYHQKPPYSLHTFYSFLSCPLFAALIAGSVNDVQTAIEHIYPLVHEFRKNRPKTEPVAPPVEAFDPDDEEALNGIAGKGGKRDASKAPAKTAQKTVKRKYPFGMAENDPDEDLMGISDVESDADDVIDEY